MGMLGGFVGGLLGGVGGAVAGVTKNIGKGITKIAKVAAGGLAMAVKPISKAVKHAASVVWSNPLLRTAAIAGAMYFSAGTLAPMLMEGGSLGLSLGATTAGALSGAATLSVLSAAGAKATGGNWKKAAVTGAAMGAVGGAATGYFGGITSPADQAANAQFNAATNGSIAPSTGQGFESAATHTFPSAPSATTGFQAGTSAGGSTSGGVLGNLFGGSGSSTAAATNTAANNAAPSLLSKAGTFVEQHPMASMMGLQALSSMTQPSQIDLQNNQAALQQQAYMNRLNANVVPNDTGAVAPMTPIQAQNANMQMRLNPVAQVNPFQQTGLLYNANNYAMQY